jgi:hypothetical protein
MFVKVDAGKKTSNKSIIETVKLILGKNKTYLKN